MAAQTASNQQAANRVKVSTPMETLPFQILHNIQNNHSDAGPRKGQMCNIRIDLQDRNYHIVEYADGFTQRCRNEGSFITRFVQKQQEQHMKDDVDNLADLMNSLMISRQQLNALKIVIEHLKQGNAANIANLNNGHPKSGVDQLRDQIVGLSLSNEGKNASSDDIVKHVSNDLNKVAASGGIDDLISKLQQVAI